MYGISNKQSDHDGKQYAADSIQSTKNQITIGREILSE
ncbi:hypothetical protein D046_5952 [Vibrio parahaemolyticus V-223/04]|nr:hypothetical protein D046_5952 [Vibrio parahaemolyticus V-223/04]